jgi:hypothetical protein
MGSTPEAIDLAKQSRDFANDIDQARWEAALALVKYSIRNIEISPKFKCGMWTDCTGIRRILSNLAAISEELRRHPYAASVVNCNDVIDQMQYDLMKFLPVTDSTQAQKVQNSKVGNRKLLAGADEQKKQCAQNDMISYVELRHNVTVWIMKNGYLAGIKDPKLNEAKAEADRGMYERGLSDLDDTKRTELGLHYEIAVMADLNHQDFISETSDSSLRKLMQVAAGAAGCAMFYVMITGFGFWPAAISYVVAPLLSMFVYFILPYMWAIAQVPVTIMFALFMLICMWYVAKFIDT